jgi:hypothetical protein
MERDSEDIDALKCRSRLWGWEVAGLQAIGRKQKIPSPDLERRRFWAYEAVL